MVSVASTWMCWWVSAVNWCYQDWPLFVRDIIFRDFSFQWSHFHLIGLLELYISQTPSSLCILESLLNGLFSAHSPGKLVPRLAQTQIVVYCRVQLYSKISSLSLILSIHGKRKSRSRSHWWRIALLRRAEAWFLFRLLYPYFGAVLHSSPMFLPWKSDWSYLENRAAKWCLSDYFHGDCVEGRIPLPSQISILRIRLGMPSTLLFTRVHLISKSLLSSSFCFNGSYAVNIEPGVKFWV